MKYTTTIDIEKPLPEVVALFDNPDYYKYWMNGFEGIEYVEGEHGQEGTKAELIFKLKKRSMRMSEEVLVSRLPEEYTVAYEANGAYNTVKNSFEALDEFSTRYTTEHEFKFSGIMCVIGFLMPGAFKKQSMRYMTDFKNFAEKHSVSAD
jgi:hypothetical protein